MLDSGNETFIQWAGRWGMAIAVSLMVVLLVPACSPGNEPDDSDNGGDAVEAQTGGDSESPGTPASIDGISDFVGFWDIASATLPDGSEDDSLNAVLEEQVDEADRSFYITLRASGEAVVTVPGESVAGTWKDDGGGEIELDIEGLSGARCRFGDTENELVVTSDSSGDLLCSRRVISGLGDGFEARLLPDEEDGTSAIDYAQRGGGEKVSRG